MHTNSISPSASSQQGVVLLEVLISILIFSIGILGIVGMQANMIKNTSESKFRADAAYVAQKQIGEMWVDQGNLNAYVDAGTVDVNELPGGNITVEQPSLGLFQVTVTWQQPGEARHTYSTMASINGGV